MPLMATETATKKSAQAKTTTQRKKGKVKPKGFIAFRKPSQQKSVKGKSQTSAKRGK